MFLKKKSIFHAKEFRTIVRQGLNRRQVYKNLKITSAVHGKKCLNSFIIGDQAQNTQESFEIEKIFGEA